MLSHNYFFLFFFGDPEMKFLGNQITAASGSLGGITASHNRGGQYFRARLVPTDPARTLQMARRAAFGALAARWLADLSSSQRDAWNDYAGNTPVVDVLGQSMLLTGQQMFVRTNTAALQASISQIDDAPIISGTGQQPVIVLAPITPTDVAVAFSSFPSSTTVLVYLGRPQNASRSFFRGPWRFAGTATSSPSSDTPPFVVGVGQRVWVYARYLNDDGRLSQATQFGPVTVEAGP
jgi:hypothetical protein